MDQDGSEGMTHLERLRELRDILHKRLHADDGHSMAQIARQYRETLDEIELLEMAEPDDNGLDSMLG